MLLFRSFITRVLIISEMYKMRLCLQTMETFFVSVRDSNGVLPFLIHVRCISL